MKYVPGLMVGQLSGKAGSTVASRNKGGSYFRTRVIPKHIVNADTTAVRANFGSSAQAYRGLSDAERLAWTTLGASLVRKTSLGEAIHLTGLQALQAINRNLFTADISPNYIAPAFESPAALEILNITAAPGAPDSTTVVAGANSATQHLTSTAAMYEGASLTFVTAGVTRSVLTVVDATHVILNAPVNSTTAEAVDFVDEPAISVSFFPTPVPSGTKLVIETTGALSQGINAPSRGQFRVIRVETAGVATPVDISDDFFQKFGLAQAGAKIFARARLVSVTGFAGPVLQAVAIVT